MTSNPPIGSDPDEETLYLPYPNYYDDDSGLENWDHISVPVRPQGLMTMNCTFLDFLKNPIIEFDPKIHRRFRPISKWGFDTFIRRGEVLIRKKNMSTEDLEKARVEKGTPMVPLRACISGIPMPKNVPEEEEEEWFFSEYEAFAVALEDQWSVSRDFAAGVGGALSYINTGTYSISPGDAIAWVPEKRRNGHVIDEADEIRANAAYNRQVLSSVPVSKIDTSGWFNCDKQQVALIRYLFKLNPNLVLIPPPNFQSVEPTVEQRRNVERDIKEYLQKRPPELKKELNRVAEEDSRTYMSKCNARVKAYALTQSEPGEPGYAIWRPAGNVAEPAIKRMRVENVEGERKSS